MGPAEWLSSHYLLTNAITVYFNFTLWVFNNKLYRYFYFVVKRNMKWNYFELWRLIHINKTHLDHMKSNKRKHAMEFRT